MLLAPDATPVSAPAFAAVRTAAPYSAQKASDQGASTEMTANQLRAWNMVGLSAVFEAVEV